LKRTTSIKSAKVHLPLNQDNKMRPLRLLAVKYAIISKIRERVKHDILGCVKKDNIIRPFWYRQKTVIPQPNPTEALVSVFRAAGSAGALQASLIAGRPFLNIQVQSTES